MGSLAPRQPCARDVYHPLNMDILNTLRPFPLSWRSWFHVANRSRKKKQEWFTSQKLKQETREKKWLFVPAHANSCAMVPKTLTSSKLAQSSPTSTACPCGSPLLGGMPDWMMTGWPIESHEMFLCFSLGFGLGFVGFFFRNRLLKCTS